jgi:dTDP-4-amino-4,6-dideoxygalactose transaminase
MHIPKWPYGSGRELELLEEVLTSDHWGSFHPFISRFEREFSTFQDCTHGISVTSGTTAIEAVLQAAGIGPEDEVIVPAISFIATATAVSRTGARPVFVDIEEFSFNIDPEQVERAVTPRTRAVIAVHFGGPMADIDRLLWLTQKHDLLLIEDAAHAHGSTWNGRKAGSFGLAGTFSFQNSKVMTAGEGGIVVTNNGDFAAKVRSFADIGRKPGGGWFHHYTLGTNARLSALQCAVLLAQLERLPEQTRLRAANAGRIREALADVSGLVFQQIPDPAISHSHYLLLARVDSTRAGVSRDDLLNQMLAANVPGFTFYPHTLYQNPLYRTAECRVEPCPISEAYIRDAFWMSHRLLMGDLQMTNDLINLLRGVFTRRPDDIISEENVPAADGSSSISTI